MTWCLSGYRTGPPVCANLARRKSLKAGSTREKKGVEEQRNVSNSMWQFGTGNRKYRWRARVYPERETEMLLRLQPLELRVPCKARWVWADAATKYLFGHVPIVVCPSRQRGDAVVAGQEQLGRRTAGTSNYYRPYLYSGKLTLAAMYHRKARVVGSSFPAGAPPLTHVSAVVSPAPSAETSAYASGGAAGGKQNHYLGH
jgi:hypothetical protein